jgi:hypothetical protein
MSFNKQYINDQRSNDLVHIICVMFIDFFTYAFIISHSYSGSPLILTHFAANESTRRRLIGYTLAEYLALIVASGLQVYFIRRLFSRSVAYNRV